MLSPNYLASLPNEFVALWAEVEQDIVNAVAKRIVKTDFHIGYTSEWQIKKLLEMSKLRGDVVKGLAAATKTSTKMIDDILTDAGITGLQYDDAIYRAAGLTVPSLASSPALRDVLMAGITQTNGLMKNLDATTADTAQKAFYNALDKAWVQLMSGAYTPQQAISDAVKDIAKNGMETIAYPTGHVDKTDVAVRRAILTGANQTTAKLQIARADEMGCDLVEVTAHAGARPSHAEWQGRIYSRSGKNKGYKHFETVTGYGTGDGLCGWNCYHNFYPYFEGLSSPSFSTDPSKDYLGKSNDEMYEQQQEQRAYERSIRASKRECSALDAALNATTDDEVKAELKEAFTAASAKLRKRKKALIDFLDRTERTRNEEREAVTGFGHSTSAKVTWANRKAAAAKKPPPPKKPNDTSTAEIIF